MKTALLTKSIPLLALSPIVTTFAFLPQNIPNQRHSSIIPNSSSSSSRGSFTASVFGRTPVTKTRLNDGVLIDVPEDFFTYTGILLGVSYSLSKAINRVVLENVAWENRLEDKRQRKLNDEDGINLYTELELRRQDAARAKSAYGPEATERRGIGRGGGRVDTKENEGRVGDRMYSMTDKQIREFEVEYGVKYDPYYDEPYTEDELPDDIKFWKDKAYGDRRYVNGEIFYQDEDNKKVYWRQGGRPRLRKFWEFSF